MTPSEVHFFQPTHRGRPSRLGSHKTRALANRVRVDLVLSEKLAKHVFPQQAIEQAAEALLGAPGTVDNVTAGDRAGGQIFARKRLAPQRRAFARIRNR